ncbi:MAG: 50S ribosomal protein L25/general stress protein Ctc [Mariprofundaceae bacterium]
MSDFLLEAELREQTGKGAARRLRRAGGLPAIIYGGDKPDLPIILNYNDTAKLLNNERFFTSIIDVSVKGKRGKNTVLLKEAQWDPLTDNATHLDLHRVSATDMVQVTVPVQAINQEKSPGIVVGGMLSVIRHSLDVSCRADAIPDVIEVDCSTLDVGDSIHVEDLVLDKGVEVPHEVNFTVIAMVAPTIEKEVVEDDDDVVVEEVIEE